jgi:hypothetical protein
MALLAVLFVSFIGAERPGTAPSPVDQSVPEPPQSQMPVSIQTARVGGHTVPSLQKRRGLGVPDSPSEPAGLPGVGLAERTAPVDDPSVRKLVVSLQEMASSFDPKTLPGIEVHLYSPNPLIRAEAVNAVLNMGDAAGAEVLRRASRAMSDPKEELETLEKAAFLRLPSGSLKAAGDFKKQ